MSQLFSYFSTDLASINPMGLEVGDRRNRTARSRFLATKKRADFTPRSSPKRTYTVTWSARLPSNLARRTYHGVKCTVFTRTHFGAELPARTSRTCSLRSESCASRLTRWTRGATRHSSNRADRRPRAGGPIAQELLRQAASLLFSHPFVARGDALGGHGVAHADRFASPAAVASRGSRWRQRAWRRVRPPPALRRPTDRAPTIA